MVNCSVELLKVSSIFSYGDSAGSGQPFHFSDHQGEYRHGIAGNASNDDRFKPNRDSRES
jgi:hypothetical protein